MNSFLLATLLLVQGAVSASGNGTVQGRIIAADGTPVSGIRVTALAQREPGQSESVSAHVSIAQTDSSGRYRLENVPAGRYYITAGLIDIPTYYPGVSALSGATIVLVADGARLDGIDFSIRVPAGMKVSGRLVVMPTALATPPTVALVASAVTVITGSGAFGRVETSVNTDGSFEFLRVLPGSYTLANFVGLPPLPVVVTDKDVTGLEIGRDAVGVRVSGRVLSPGSPPSTMPAQGIALMGTARSAPGAVGALTAIGGGLSLSVRPDVNGAFEFVRVPPGSYTLRALPTPFWANHQQMSLTVADKDIADLEIRVPFQAEISGRVVLDGGGQPNLSTNTQIEVRRGTGTSWTPVQPDGSFRIQVGEGDQQLGLRGLPLGYRIQSISTGDTNLLTSPLKVGPGNVPANILVTLASVPLDSIAGVKVSGRITGVGASLAGSRIVLRGADSGAYSIETAPNADGTFEFPTVPPGNYTATVTGIPNGQPTPLATRITVGTDNMTGIQIPVEIRTVISGRLIVVDATGAVVPTVPSGVSVSFRRGTGGSSTTVRPDGGFSVPLPPGEHTISFSIPEGYTVTSVVSGFVDLLKNPLKVEQGFTPAIEARMTKP